MIFVMQKELISFSRLNNSIMKSQVYVDNLKCDGCAASITKGLKSFPEVSTVMVDPENDLIEVEYSNTLSFDKVKEKLFHLGYPEKKSLHGLGKVAANVKSYISCAIGRVTKE